MKFISGKVKADNTTYPKTVVTTFGVIMDIVTFSETTPISKFNVTKTILTLSLVYHDNLKKLLP